MKATMTYVPSLLGEGFFRDVPVPGSGDDDKALVYDHGTGEFAFAGHVQVFNIVSYGADPTGSADCTTAILAADAAAEAAGGGIVWFPAGTYRADGQIILANDGGTPAKMKARKWIGAGCWQSGKSVASNPNGGTILDLRYSSGPCILAKPEGNWEVTGITFNQQGTAHAQPYLRLTNTTAHIYVCAFVGHSTKTTTSCNQDAIEIGGTSTTIGNSDLGPFQGYGTVIERCWFNRIKRGVWGRMYANALVIINNTWWAQCGGSAAIEFDGGGDSVNYNVGGTITGNLIECVGYTRAMKFNYVINFCIESNHFYDDAAIDASGYIEIGNNCIYNYFVAGHYVSAKPFVSQVNTNTIIDPNQSQYSYFPQYVSFTNTLQLNSFRVTGGSGAALIKPSATGTDSVILLDMQKSDGTSVFKVQQGGNITVGGNQDGAIEGSTWAIGPATWRRKGAGGGMVIDSGTGGSFVDLKGFAVRIYDHTGALGHRFGAGGVGFFTKASSPATQQTGGAATAGATYTSAEQNMLQKAYDALRAFGLLS